MDEKISDDVNPANASPESYRTAFEQIKSLYATDGPKLTGNETLREAKRIAYAPRGGRRLSIAETVNVMLKAANLGIYLGPPMRLKAKGSGRGPQCKDDQYDRQTERAWHWLRSIARPERSRLTVRGATDATRAKAQVQRDKISSLRTRISPRINEAKVVRAILDEMAREGVKPPSARTIRRALGASKTRK